MEAVKQLQFELSDANQRKIFFEEELKKLQYCIDVLQKELTYRTI